MHISRGQPSIKLYELCSIILQSVTGAKYLGITIRHDLHWGDHVNSVGGKGNTTISYIETLNIATCLHGRWPIVH